MGLLLGVMDLLLGVIGLLLGVIGLLLGVMGLSCTTAKFTDDKGSAYETLTFYENIDSSFIVPSRDLVMIFNIFVIIRVFCATYLNLLSRVSLSCVDRCLLTYL